MTFRTLRSQACYRPGALRSLHARTCWSPLQAPLIWHMRKRTAMLSDACTPGRRGKRQQKRYDVFVGGVTPEVQAAFQPHLNDEHREARWWPLEASQLKAAELHPVVVSSLGTTHGMPTTSPCHMCAGIGAKHRSVSDIALIPSHVPQAPSSLLALLAEQAVDLSTGLTVALAIFAWHVLQPWPPLLPEMQAAILEQPLSASLAAALPHWQAQQPLQEAVALAEGANSAAEVGAFLQRRGAGMLYGCVCEFEHLRHSYAEWTDTSQDCINLSSWRRCALSASCAVGTRMKFGAHILNG